MLVQPKFGWEEMTCLKCTKCEICEKNVCMICDDDCSCIKEKPKKDFYEKWNKAYLKVFPWFIAGLAVIIVMWGIIQPSSWQEKDICTEYQANVNNDTESCVLNNCVRIDNPFSSLDTDLCQCARNNLSVVRYCTTKIKTVQYGGSLDEIDNWADTITVDAVSPG